MADDINQVMPTCLLVHNKLHSPSSLGLNGMATQRQRMCWRRRRTMGRRRGMLSGEERAYEKIEKGGY